MTIRVFSILFAVVIAVSGCNGGGGGTSSANLDNIEDANVFDKTSYLLGFQLGDALLSELSRDSMAVTNINTEILFEGAREALNGDSLRMEDMQAIFAMSVFADSLLMQRLRREAPEDTTAQQHLEEIAENLAASDSFFTSIEGTEGLQTSATGMKYVVLTEGEGEAPGYDNQLQIEVKTTHIDGTEITDLTTAVGTPTPYSIGALPVFGINEALLEMLPGESRRLFLDHNHILGTVGRPGEGSGSIPPATPIIMDVTLLDVMDPIDPALLQQLQQQGPPPAPAQQ